MKLPFCLAGLGCAILFGFFFFRVGVKKPAPMNSPCIRELLDTVGAFPHTHAHPPILPFFLHIMTGNRKLAYPFPRNA
jgi:hypothetical protein